jgi:Domain of unknown function (DUF4397)
MKHTIIKTVFAAVILITAGCKKVIDYNADRTFVAADEALLKINYTSAYAFNPSVQLVINGQRASGLITGRTPFPGGGYNTNGSNFPDYLKVPATATSLKISIPQKNTNVDSVVLYNVNTAALKAGSFYTLHVADTLTKTNSLLTEDDVTMPIPGISVFRFVNTMPNVPFLDLYFNTTLVAGGVPYLGAGTYFSLPVPATAGTWFIREAGTSTTSTALTSYSSANTNISQRVYTVFASGYKNATATNTKPYVSFFLTR